jgi:hypothetical protein
MLKTALTGAFIFKLINRVARARVPFVLAWIL